jgi:uncharacterized protein (DUF2336 family)
MSADLGIVLSDMANVADPSRRDDMLLRIVDLYERDMTALGVEQVALFDTVLLNLPEKADPAARAALAERVADEKRAPPNLLGNLTLDRHITVAGPILMRSTSISDEQLLACARLQGQDHLLAIAGRAVVPAIITDVLSERGELPVLGRVAANTGARFSESGFSRMIGRSHEDEQLALMLGMRADLPRHQFLRLMADGSDRVRARLQEASPHRPPDLEGTIAHVSRLMHDQKDAQARDFGPALARLSARHEAGALQEEAIAGIAATGAMEDVIVALSLRCDVPIGMVEQAFDNDRAEGILVMARALGLSWATTRALIMRKGGRPCTSQVLEQAAFGFERLKPATAVQALGLQRLRARAAVS